MAYSLTGDFVECCDCFTVCPCWVNDVPDEDHCSGLYVWSFAPGSRIGAIEVGGMHVAAAAFHAVRSRGQAIFFVDAGGQSHAFSALVDAFSGHLKDAGLAALHKLLGDVLAFRPATITSTFGHEHFDVEVKVDDDVMAKAEGADKSFDGVARPMTLRDAALTDELGIGDGPVTIQAMKQLTVDVAALPGGPLYLRGRSGMRGRFSYTGTGEPQTSSSSEDDARAGPRSVPAEE